MEISSDDTNPLPIGQGSDVWGVGDAHLSGASHARNTNLAVAGGYHSIESLLDSMKTTVFIVSSIVALLIAVGVYRAISLGELASPYERSGEVQTAQPIADSGPSTFVNLPSYVECNGFSSLCRVRI